MLKLLLEDNNLLLLDEPTNHLDMGAKESLETALNEYEGTLVTVSHDRWFLDQVVNRIWEVHEGRILITPGITRITSEGRRGCPRLGKGTSTQRRTPKEAS